MVDDPLDGGEVWWPLVAACCAHRAELMGRRSADASKGPPGELVVPPDGRLMQRDGQVDHLRPGVVVDLQVPVEGGRDFLLPAA